MEVPALVVRFAASALLLFAALEKARSLPSFRAVIDALRLGRIAGPISRTVPALELVTGAGLLVAPRQRVFVVLLVLLAVSFAGAGLIAVARGADVVCHCLGTNGSDRLGWRQLQLLPLWLVAAALLGTSAADWSVSDGCNDLAATVTALGCVQGARLMPSLRRARGYRRATEASLDGQPSLFMQGG